MKEKRGIVLWLCKTWLFMYLLSGILLLLLTFALAKLELSQTVVTMGIEVIYVMSGFFGGLLAGKKWKNRKLIWGLLMGGGYFLILTVISSLFGSGMEGEVRRLVTTFIMCVASGMVGGMVS